MAKADRAKLCGKLLVDFANADTSDEAGFDFISNVQKVFEYPPQFTYKAQRKFPELKSFFNEFDSSEKVLLDLFIEEINTEQGLTDKGLKVFLEGYEYDLEDYKYEESRKLCFTCDVSLDDDLPGDECLIKLGKSKIRNQEKLQDLFFKYNTYRDIIVDMNNINENEDLILEMCSNFIDDIFKYVEIGNRILEILHVKKLVSLERYKQIETKAYYYYNLIKKEHDHIDTIRTRLCESLKRITKNHQLSKDDLEDILSIYNNIKISKLYVTEKGDIEEQTSFVNQKIFLNRDDKNNFSSAFGYYSKFHCNCIYHQIISYSFVNFLRNANSKNLLKECPYCKSYFIAEDERRSKCYSSACIKKYEREKKRKQREDDPVTYL